ncbi:hypothetical protein PZB75_30305 [Streptomyces sp. AM 4-1-1]|uniref:orotate phosphoribosyltransferase n=1 Tax=unclassified Streptomyces TaxID=2593676 RepID=UPI0023B8B348|nr:hypothetical protein [Streptomyces sp. AM 4-1-1]WEH37278.1 hypothetical protein PZB75_30305 [Streptomyces sp. AM 4-1-1]
MSTWDERLAGASICEPRRTFDVADGLRRLALEAGYLPIAAPARPEVIRARRRLGVVAGWSVTGTGAAAHMKKLTDILDAPDPAFTNWADGDLDLDGLFVFACSLAGPALAGISLATAVSLHTGLPAAYVRPAPKTHGTFRQIEGADLDGRRTALIDDTARSGTSLLHSARLLRIAGAKVATALCVLDRDAGATALLAEHRLPLTALLTDPGSTT